MEDAARGLGTNGARALSTYYKDGLNPNTDTATHPAEYANEFLRYYEAGKQGTSQNSIIHSGADPLTPAQKAAAYNAGMNDAAAGRDIGKGGSEGRHSNRVTNGAEKTFTQGSKMPAEVLETKPKYSPMPDKWLDNGGQITIENGTWKYTNTQGDSVAYKNGYPDFKGSGHVKQEVDIGGFANRTTDFKKADQIAPNGPKSPDSTWHHYEDGKTLHEVNKKIHEQFRHQGGIAGMKKNK